MKSVIEATNLVKVYRDKQAVNGLTFQVREGECYGLLGPNGAGKTSTFKMMYGSASITSGELFVFDLNVKKHIRKIKSLVGVVPQENGLDPDFSAYDNLVIYSNYFGIPKVRAKDRISELLGLMQLEDHADKKIDQLSGGMRRRLVLARALLTEARLIFLDEPTTGLDPQARLWIWDELKALQKKGSTLFLTTHYMEEAEQLCDRILIMNEGRTVAEGEPEDLILEHVGKEVIEFEIGPKDIEYYVSKVKGKFYYQIMRTGLKLFIRDEQNPRDAINEVSSKNITMRKASLNDVFLKISGHELHD